LRLEAIRNETTTGPAVPLDSLRKPDGEKHYDTDWAKAKVHVLLGETLDKTLLTFKKPKEIRVLHFSGIDAQETKDVYLSRGIPAQNITTLERDPAIAERIDGLGLGIKVITNTLEDFVNDSASKGKKLDYDVISLDFTGPISTATLNLIHKTLSICSSNYLLLHTANLLKRDGADVYESNLPVLLAAKDMLHYFHNNHAAISEAFETGKGMIAGERVQSSTAYVKSALGSNKERVELKRQGYPLLIFSCFEHNPPEDFLIMLKFLYRDVDFVTSEDKRVFVATGHPELDKLFELNQGRIQEDIGERFLIPKMASYLRSQGVKPQYAMLAVSSLLTAIRGYPVYMPQNGSHYSYISESGAPMVGSIIYSFKANYFDATQELARSCGFPSEFSIKDRNRFHKALGDCVTKIRKLSVYMARFAALNEDDITFLGNSSKPVLTKERFIKELENDQTIDEVKVKYRGWAEKPLPQWKAHFTMGTYGERQPEDSESTKDLVVEAEDADIERISKDDALNLLASGIPPSEIYDAYPTSFSVGQLRAFKAHLTMGHIPLRSEQPS
jgi:hypothetical protein